MIGGAWSGISQDRGCDVWDFDLQITRSAALDLGTGLLAHMTPTDDQRPARKPVQTDQPDGWESEPAGEVTEHGDTYDRQADDQQGRRHPGRPALGEAVEGGRDGQEDAEADDELPDREEHAEERVFREELGHGLTLAHTGTGPHVP